MVMGMLALAILFDWSAFAVGRKQNDNTQKGTHAHRQIQDLGKGAFLWENLWVISSGKKINKYLNDRALSKST